LDFGEKGYVDLIDLHRFVGFLVAKRIEVDQLQHIEIRLFSKRLEVQEELTVKHFNE